VASTPNFPYIILGISLFGILALGFRALTEAQGLIYPYARLAESERCLGFGLTRYYLRDSVEHAIRR